MFERKGVITVPVEAVDEDTITLTAAEGGAEDVAPGRRHVGRHVASRTTSAALRRRSRTPASRSTPPSLSLLPKTQVEVDADQARTLLRLVDALEENDDVQDVYFNFDIPDAVLADA